MLTVLANSTSSTLITELNNPQRWRSHSVAFHTSLVYKGRQHFRGAEVQGILEQIDLFKVYVKQLAYLHDEHQHKGLRQARQAHVKDLLPAVGAVNLGCLVQYAVNARQGGNVDHRAPAHALPQAGNYVNRYKVFGNALVIDGRTAMSLVSRAREPMLGDTMVVIMDTSTTVETKCGK